MNTSTALFSFIEDRKKDLFKYAQRSDAKDGYINNQNEQIRQLTCIYNNIPTDTNQSIGLGSKIVQEYNRLKSQDANFCGLTIHIRENEQGVLCVLNLDPKNYGI
jgi:predicted transcriptional regulator YheO